MHVTKRNKPVQKGCVWWDPNPDVRGRHYYGDSRKMSGCQGLEKGEQTVQRTFRAVEMLCVSYKGGHTSSQIGPDPTPPMSLKVNYGLGGHADQVGSRF